jgi:beta-lactamase superfamily II metal-dependent hydrolase
MLRLELLPAHHGDCLLIEYGPKNKPRRVLIDGGTPHSYDAVDARLAKIGERVDLELLVVTHVDEDHIGGTLAHFVKNPGRLAPKDVWFNAYQHLFPPDAQGPAQAEGLSTAIEQAEFAWNAAFEKLEVSVVVPDKGPLPTIELDGDAKITLLSPTWKKLEQLQGKWEAACKEANLIPGQGAEPDDVLGRRPPPEQLTPTKVRTLAKTPFKRDPSRPNGSSIAFLFEHKKKRLLLTGDAHPDALLSSLRRIQKEPLEVDAWKMSHHGSRGNLDTSLLDQVVTQRFLFSTDSGTFGHPDPETIARIITRREPAGKTLYFNYDTDYTRPWADATLCEELGYEAVYADDDGHLILAL